MEATRYQKACVALGYKYVTIEQYDFLPENQRLSAFVEHKLITCIEHANMVDGKKWIINWLDGSEKWRNWFWAQVDKNRPSGLGFSFIGASGCDRSHTAVGSRLYFRTREIARELGNDPEILEYVNEYIQ